MRFPKQSISQKTFNPQIIRTNCKPRRIPPYITINDASCVNFDNMNEFNRNMSKQTEVKASWKVLPKDSCEVYKERQKRQLEDKNERTTKNRYERRVTKPRKNRRKPPRRQPLKKKNVPQRNTKSRRRSSKRPPSSTSCISSACDSYTTTEISDD